MLRREKLSARFARIGCVVGDQELIGIAEEIVLVLLEFQRESGNALQDRRQPGVLVLYRVAQPVAGGVKVGEQAFDVVFRRMAICRSFNCLERRCKVSVQAFVGVGLGRNIGKELANELFEIADLMWNMEDTPEDDESIKLAKKADKMRQLADKVRVFSTQTQPGNVRWIERETSKLVNVPFDVSAFIGGMAGFTTDTIVTTDRTCCARCGRALTAAVHVLEGMAYGPDCIRHVDLFGDAEIVPLSEWTTQTIETEVKHQPTAIIFTSATIAAPDLKHFMRTCGLSHGFQMIADSPFDYEANALLYIPNGESPAPSAPNWQGYMIEELRKLVISAKGGAFLLFTSYSNMKYAVASLKGSFESAGLKVLVQNELPKGEITKQFKADGNAVLFATKSFWEGISIEGAALRLVAIDKMPFAAPSPLMKARESVVDNPFVDLNVPEMVIDLKQGTGRLIRRMDDWGVLAILDSRIRLKPYGRSMVLPALPQARLTASTFEVDEFFEKRREVVRKIVSDFPVTVDQKVWDELEELGF